MFYGYILIACLTVLLVGYSVGRRIGIKEGKKIAINRTIIELKADYYTDKKCPICLSNLINKAMTYNLCKISLEGERKNER